MIRRLLVPVAAAALLAATLPFTASAAPVGTGVPAAVGQAPITYTVCYRKRTGEMRLLLSTKCPRGWKRIRLAAPREVIDANGTVLGSFLGIQNWGFFPVIAVEAADGSRWNYAPNGTAIGSNSGVVHLDAACTSPVYTIVPGAQLALYGTLDPTAREVVVVNNVAVAAYALAGAPTPHGAAPVFYRDETGACGPAWLPANAYRVPLTQVPLPVQGVGPLSIV